MGDFEEKLNNILSSPADMERIMQLARSLSPSDGEKHGGDARQTRGENPRGGDNPSEKKAADKTDGNSSGSPFEGLDPKMLSLIGRFVGAYSSKGNDKASVFAPFRPYLKDDQRHAIDKALEISKMAKLAKIALGEFSGGDFNL